MKYLKKLFGFFGQESESKQEVTSASEVVNEVSEVEATKPQEKSSTSVEDSKLDVSVSDLEKTVDIHPLKTGISVHFLSR